MTFVGYTDDNVVDNVLSTIGMEAMLNDVAEDLAEASMWIRDNAIPRTHAQRL